MKRQPLQRRTLAVLVVIIPLFALFVYVALSSGPLAPVSVTVETVKARSIHPVLFGIGTIEARYTYKIGPISTGRIQSLAAHVGDRVTAGQVLGEMDPVDSDARIRSREATLKHAQAILREARARQAYAQTQAHRYEQLLAARSTSEEITSTKRQELQIANAALSAAQEDLSRAQADLAAAVVQRENLRFVAPAEGLVAVRDADPGTTVAAGRTVLEIIDPKSLWIHTRFDQISASGLAAGLPAHIALRSRSGQSLTGHVFRVEPRADAVTEETLAKVVFDPQPLLLPPVGELAEVTIDLPALPLAPVIPNAAIHHHDGRIGVWRIEAGALRFTPVRLGAADLSGQVQVLAGLKAGDQVVVYSEQALHAYSRFRLVEHIPGLAQ